MFQRFFLVFSTIILICFSTSIFAAKVIDLKFQPASVLQAMSGNNQISFKEVSSTSDLVQKTHVRLQETYANYPVWGGELIVHYPSDQKTSLFDGNATVSGIIYQDLNKDLQKIPESNQAQKALNYAQQLYQKKNGSLQNKNHEASELIVYVDKNNLAHWSYLVSFAIQPQYSMPALPTYIIDAMTFEIYKQWNNVQTLEKTQAGGFSGNLKMGKKIYDGLNDHLPKLSIQRDPGTKMCFLQNDEVIVNDLREGPHLIAQFFCEAIDSQHNDVYWNGEHDAVNGAYSPANDALFAGKMVKDMYQTWYQLAVIKVNKWDVKEKPILLTMNAHMIDIDNAFFFPLTLQTYYGDGQTYYPLVSLGIAAHEMSHGFTQQRSGLAYDDQSGGLNEAFSDMASQAAEFFVTGHNNWQIMPEIIKGEGAYRYMDDPTKDCPPDRTPGDECSIGHMSQYKEGIDVHYISGIFNKAYYLMGTSNGWNAKKAFDVMVQANLAYWRSTTDFYHAANCVLKAAEDLNYDEGTVRRAFAEVGILGVHAGNCN